MAARHRKTVLAIMAAGPVIFSLILKILIERGVSFGINLVIFPF